VVVLAGAVSYATAMPRAAPADPPMSWQSPPFGPLRIDLQFDPPYVDPALSFDSTLEYATCAKLVNYPDAPPPEGTRLQPETAAAMPTISQDGRTYTFRIRHDYAFSPPATGVVTAESMKYTFERTLSPDMGLNYW